MKLVEYLAPLKNASQQSRILAVMLFLERTEGKTDFTIADIRTLSEGVSRVSRAGTSRLDSQRRVNMCTRPGLAPHGHGNLRAREGPL